MIFRILFNWIIPPLKPYERKLIDSLNKHLSPEAGSLLVKQVSQINYVQRHAKQKEINFYSIKHAKPFFDKKLQFPMKLPEAKLASLTFVAPEISGDFCADIWLVNGYLFSIEFNKGPKNIKSNVIEIKQVILFIDPMVTINSPSTSLKKPEELIDWLNVWAKKWNLRKLREPISRKRREEIIGQLDTKLPNDYLGLVFQTEGLEIDNCLIYGISEMRSLVLPEANYCVLADISEHGVLAVKKESFDGEIYFLSYQNKPPIKFGSSFRLAIEQLLSDGDSGM